MCIPNRFNCTCELILALGSHPSTTTTFSPLLSLSLSISLSPSLSLSLSLSFFLTSSLYLFLSHFLSLSVLLSIPLSPSPQSLFLYLPHTPTHQSYVPHSLLLQLHVLIHELPGRCDLGGRT